MRSPAARARFASDAEQHGGAGLRECDARSTRIGGAGSTLALRTDSCETLNSASRAAKQPAELLFKNAQLVNVFSGEIHPRECRGR